jgi:Uma2 family endonuclease
MHIWPTTSYKRSEYAARGIAEYWIVDPDSAKFTVLTLVDGFYEEAIFQGNDPIISTIFPQLILSSTQIFTL